ncbi:ATP-binding protein [Bacteriovoracaceae bacterium]|nr:ATP-binding protein [Bacteriovoracaceae bacterium]
MKDSKKIDSIVSAHFIFLGIGICFLFAYFSIYTYLNSNVPWYILILQCGAFMVILFALMRLKYIIDLLQSKIFDQRISLKTSRAQLIKSSHLAGMSEVATGVLHNVGNILNGVNSSVEVVINNLRNSKIAGLEKSGILIDQNMNNISDFFSNNPQGKLLPQFIVACATQMAKEHQTNSKTLTQLKKQVDNINRIINIQQSLARAGESVEEIHIGEIIEQAININFQASHQLGVTIVKNFQFDLKLETDRIKLLQIVNNLISNGIDALKDVKNPKYRVLRIFATREDDVVTFAFEDTGCGIDEKQMEKIFQYGHTTKKGGHGFGLHNSANAAKEMGGELHVTSRGPGRGSKFSLILPSKPSNQIKDGNT